MVREIHSATDVVCGYPGELSCYELSRSPWACRALNRSVQAARKPNSVLGDHSSRRAITAPLQQPTRRFRSFRERGRGESAPENLRIAANTVRVFRKTHLHLGAPGRYALAAEEAPASPCLFGLAPCGVYRAVRITADAVGSYPTLSPLPQAACMGVPVRITSQKPEAVCFLLHWPYPAP